MFNSQFSIPNSHRMRIENWELRIEHWSALAQFLQTLLGRGERFFLFTESKPDDVFAASRIVEETATRHRRDTNVLHHKAREFHVVGISPAPDVAHDVVRAPGQHGI